MEFQNRLRELRYENNMTQNDLARVLSLSIPTISAYESGRRSPDQDTLKLISTLFNVSTDYLLGLSNIRIRPIEKLQVAELTDENTVLTFKGHPISKEDMKLIRRILRGNDTD